MRKYNLMIFIFCLITTNLLSQTNFIRHYGEFSGQGNSIILNSDNNYIVTGRKNFHSNFDQFYICELNSYGDTLWLNHYGTDSLEQANQIIQTIDGGYATVGFSSGYMSYYRCMYLVKTTNLGIVSWTKKIGGLGSENGISIVQENSGEYYIGGSSKYNSNGLFDFYLLKLNENGDTIWTKKYGGSQNDEAYSMHQTDDGGFIIGGYSESYTNGSKDIYIVKVDNLGDTLWTKHYGGNLIENLRSIKQTIDGGYIMTGYSESFGVSTENMYVIKTNSIGDTLWSKTYGQIGRYSHGKDIIQTFDGGYVITGLIKTASSNGGWDLYLLKINELGNIQWENEFKIEPTNTAYTSSEGRSIIQTPDGGLAIAGSWFSASTYELLLIKTNENGLVEINKTINNNETNVIPNPFQQHAIIQFANTKNENLILKIINNEGTEVYINNHITTNYIDIYRRNLKSGLYFFQIYNQDKIKESGKFIIE